MNRQPDVDPRGPARKKTIRWTAYSGATLAAVLIAIWWTGVGSNTDSHGRPTARNAANHRTGSAPARPSGWDGAWSDDYRDAFDDKDAGENEGQGVEQKRHPVRNINRLFMVLRPEDGMGPPPGARAGQ